MEIRYSISDGQADNNTFINNALAQQPGKLDYVTIGSSALGASAIISINLHNGNVYIGGGGAVPVIQGASVTFGVIPAVVNQAPIIQADKTNGFLNGGSFGGSVCAFGGCVGGYHAFGADTSVEVGVEFGGFTRTVDIRGSGSTGASLPVFVLP